MTELGSVVKVVLPLALALVACAPRPQNPSPESKFLQSQLVPAMNQWSKTSSPVMPLNEIAEIRSFDYLCAVPEYQDHSSIEAELPNVKNYRGSTGEMVPETRIAVIGVKGNAAHVAYLRRNPLTIYGHARRCYRASHAVLQRQRRQGTNLPWASLGEDQ